MSLPTSCTLHKTLTIWLFLVLSNDSVLHGFELHVTSLKSRYNWKSRGFGFFPKRSKFSHRGQFHGEHGASPGHRYTHWAYGVPNNHQDKSFGLGSSRHGQHGKSFNWFHRRANPKNIYPQYRYYNDYIYRPSTGPYDSPTSPNQDMQPSTPVLYSDSPQMSPPKSHFSSSLNPSISPENQTSSPMLPPPNSHIDSFPPSISPVNSPIHPPSQPSKTASSPIISPTTLTPSNNPSSPGINDFSLTPTPSSSPMHSTNPLINPPFNSPVDLFSPSMTPFSSPINHLPPHPSKATTNHAPLNSPAPPPIPSISPASFDTHDLSPSLIPSSSPINPTIPSASTPLNPPMEAFSPSNNLVISPISHPPQTSKATSNSPHNSPSIHPKTSVSPSGPHIDNFSPSLSPSGSNPMISPPVNSFPPSISPNASIDNHKFTKNISSPPLSSPMISFGPSTSPSNHVSSPLENHFLHTPNPFDSAIDATNPPIGSPINSLTNSFSPSISPFNSHVVQPLKDPKNPKTLHHNPPMIPPTSSISPSISSSSSTSSPPINLISISPSPSIAPTNPTNPSINSPTSSLSPSMSTNFPFNHPLAPLENVSIPPLSSSTNRFPPSLSPFSSPKTPTNPQIDPPINSISPSITPSFPLNHPPNPSKNLLSPLDPPMNSFTPSENTFTPTISPINHFSPSPNPNSPTLSPINPPINSPLEPPTNSLPLDPPIIALTPAISPSVPPTNPSSPPFDPPMSDFPISISPSLPPAINLSIGSRPLGLQVGFYKGLCPNRNVDIEATIKAKVKEHFRKDQTLLPALLRLQFHDCFVHGCDASILIDGTSSEKNAGPNLSVRGYEFIDELKDVAEADCPDVVSCADIIAIATEELINLGGGPEYSVQTGRKDGLISKARDVRLPSPFGSVQQSILAFAAKNFTPEEMVVLFGGHTVGISNCVFFQDRLYEGTGRFDPNMDPNLHRQLIPTCPKDTMSNNSTFLDQNPQSSNIFDNSFFDQILKERGILPIDQALASDPQTRGFVLQFARNAALFNARLTSVMVKLQALDVLTGNQGQIRKICSKIN